MSPRCSGEGRTLRPARACRRRRHGPPCSRGQGCSSPRRRRSAGSAPAVRVRGERRARPSGDDDRERVDGRRRAWRPGPRREVIAVRCAETVLSGESVVVGGQRREPGHRQGDGNRRLPSRDEDGGHRVTVSARRSVLDGDGTPEPVRVHACGRRRGSRGDATRVRAARPRTADTWRPRDGGAGDTAGARRTVVPGASVALPCEPPGPATAHALRLPRGACHQ